MAIGGGFGKKCFYIRDEGGVKDSFLISICFFIRLGFLYCLTAFLFYSICICFFIRLGFLYCLTAFLPLIGYQHFFFAKQNMKSSSGAMSRSPKSHHFSDWLRVAKDSSFIWLVFFLYCLSAFLPLIGYQHFFFPKQKKKRWQRKSAFFTYGDSPLLPGDGNHRLRRLWRRNSQVRRCFFTFVGWFEVPLSLFALVGYRAQTPCDLYSLLLVISYHPPASYWGRSAFY